MLPDEKPTPPEEAAASKLDHDGEPSSGEHAGSAASAESSASSEREAPADPSPSEPSLVAPSPAPEGRAAIEVFDPEASTLPSPWSLALPDGRITLTHDLVLSVTTDPAHHPMLLAAFRFFATRFGLPFSVELDPVLGSLGSRSPIASRAGDAVDAVECAAALLWADPRPDARWALLGRWDNDPAFPASWLPDPLPGASPESGAGWALVDLLGCCRVLPVESAWLLVRRIARPLPGPEVVVLEYDEDPQRHEALTHLLRTRTGMGADVRRLTGDLPLPVPRPPSLVLAIEGIPDDVRARVYDRLARALSNRDTPLPLPPPDTGSTDEPAQVAASPGYAPRVVRAQDPRWEWIGPVDTVRPRDPADAPPAPAASGSGPTPTRETPAPDAATADPADAPVEPGTTAADKPFATAEESIDPAEAVMLYDAGPQPKRTSDLLAHLMGVAAETAAEWVAAAPTMLPVGMSDRRLQQVEAALRSGAQARIGRPEPSESATKR